ncbi:hypothetical protein MCERE3_00032 [Candidatus Nanopelagicaceae bacterium]
MRINNLPILVLAFNRPDLLKEQLEFLKSQKCSNLYISIDGPRVDRPGEALLVSSCIQLARMNVPEDRLNIYEFNQGCKLGVVGGIKWFFEKESSGLILEDDIRFNPILLEFVADSLIRYEFDFEVGSISGFSSLELSRKESLGANSYFHPYFSSWGWATWKSRWDYYSLESSNWQELESFKSMSSLEKSFWNKKFVSVFNDSLDTWDYQFILAGLKYGWKTLVPRINLVANVGFRPDGTHTRNHREFHLGNIALSEFRENEWPDSNSIDSKIARMVLQSQYGVRSNLLSRVKYLVKVFFYRFM